MIEQIPIIINKASLSSKRLLFSPKIPIKTEINPTVEQTEPIKILELLFIL